MADPTLFPAIGQVADQTDLAPVTEGTDPTNEDDHPVQEIESLCMECGEQGATRLLLTSIPFFREVVVMSFRCQHCGHSNNEIQAAGSIRPEGTVHTARILDRADLDRQLVRSATCEVIIPEYQLTIPAARGQLTTVEGLLRDVIADLSAEQPLRRVQNEAAYEKIQSIIYGFRLIVADSDDEGDDQSPSKSSTHNEVKIDLKEIPINPFTVTLNDPAGNSFIEFFDSMSDPKWNMRTYHRTPQQNALLGLSSADGDGENQPAQISAARALSLANIIQDGASEGEENEEIYVFPGVCSSCSHPMDTMMKRVAIPYFKEIIIMSTNCEHCGYRDNEVKSGSAVSEHGKRIKLKVEDRDDLGRDILKSETCGMTIPEIDLVLQPGTLGGRFTTLEGILDQVYEQLSEQTFVGDASTAEERGKFGRFLQGLKQVKNAERPFTLILDDPLANSYLQNLYAPDPDPNMETETYERTFEQNDELGLNDMKVEGYEEDTVNE